MAIDPDPVADIFARIDSLDAPQRRAVVDALKKKYDSHHLETDLAAGEQRRRNLDKLIERMRAIPTQSPDDGFSGADHDRVLYGGDA